MFISCSFVLVEHAIIKKGKAILFDTLSFAWFLDMRFRICECFIEKKNISFYG